MPLDLKIGDVLCLERKDSMFSPVANTISFFQKIGNIFTKQEKNLPIKASEIIHVGIMISNDYYAEVNAIGVQIKPLSDFKKGWACLLSDELREKFKFLTLKNSYLNFIEERLYDRFDYQHFFALAPYLLTGRKLFKPKKDTRLNVCSEFVAAALEQLGIENKFNNPSRMTPSDIFNEDWYKARLYIDKK